jgi:hypothetical protein
VRRRAGLKPWRAEVQRAARGGAASAAQRPRCRRLPIQERAGRRDRAEVVRTRRGGVAVRGRVVAVPGTRSRRAPDPEDQSPALPGRADHASTCSRERDERLGRGARALQAQRGPIDRGRRDGGPSKRPNGSLLVPRNDSSGLRGSLPAPAVRAKYGSPGGVLPELTPLTIALDRSGVVPNWPTLGTRTIGRADPPAGGGAAPSRDAVTARTTAWLRMCTVNSERVGQLG